MTTGPCTPARAAPHHGAHTTETSRNVLLPLRMSFAHIMCTRPGTTQHPSPPTPTGPTPMHAHPADTTQPPAVVEKVPSPAGYQRAGPPQWEGPKSPPRRKNGPTLMGPCCHCNVTGEAYHPCCLAHRVCEYMVLLCLHGACAHVCCMCMACLHGISYAHYYYPPTYTHYLSPIVSPQWRKGPKTKPMLCNACGIRYLRTRSLTRTSVGDVAVCMHSHSLCVFSQCA